LDKGAAYHGAPIFLFALRLLTSMSSRPDFFVVRSQSPAPPSAKRVDSLRIPPHSIEAEQAVLGGLMLSPDKLDLVVGQLVSSDFYRRDHQLIFQAICELAARDQPIDSVTVGDWFASNPELARGVDGAYMIELSTTTLSAANLSAYVQIVRDKAVMRQLIKVGTEIVNDSFQPEGRDSNELVASAERAVFAIAEQGAAGRSDFVSLSNAIEEAFREVERRSKVGEAITGLPTGYHEFDQMTAGLHPTDLIILAARPAMGKTALALNIAEFAACKSQKGVAIFSMEMSAQQLSLRLISAHGRIDAQRLRTGQLDDEDWARVVSAARVLKQTKLFIDDTPGLSPELLRAKCRRLKREHDLGLVVIDYLQLMSVPGNSENRATEISAISRSLKAMAKELNVPVIALSQLNRSLETRTDKRPNMADLRESGAIEQDADMVVFIYRDDYYNKENSPDKGLAEIIISKHRSGPTGQCKLKFFGEFTRFDNLIRDRFGAFDNPQPKRISHDASAAAAPIAVTSHQGQRMLAPVIKDVSMQSTGYQASTSSALDEEEICLSTPFMSMN